MFKLAIFTLLLVALLDTAYTAKRANCPMYKCSAEIKEVCGLDGVTYNNRCYMLSRNCGENILWYTGPCREPAECDIKYRCSTDYAPLCGTDGNTYRSSCMMLSQRCREVNKAYDGECQS